MAETIEISNFDIVLNVTGTKGESAAVGALSAFTDKPHPGTNQTVQGFLWDQRTWPSEAQENGLETPSIWDPSRSGVPESLLQSGIGSNQDLLIEQVEDRRIAHQTRLWSPRIRRGYFYNRDREGYLYSDAGTVEYTADGSTELVVLAKKSLAFDTTPGVPVRALKYQFNRITGEWEVLREFRKRIDFSTSDDTVVIDYASHTALSVATLETTFPEMVVVPKDDSDGPTVFLNELNEVIGTAGLSVPTDTDAATLDQLGVATGTNSEEFFLSFSPVDDTATIEIYSYDSQAAGTSLKLWTRVDTPELLVADDQYYIDVDFGVVRFGIGDADGDDIVEFPDRVVPVNHYVGAHYTTSAAISYEIRDITDDTLATGLDVNPVHRGNERGFVVLSDTAGDPFSVFFEAEDVTFISENSPRLYGPLDIGATTAGLKATVKNRQGEVLDNIEVTFEILDPIKGSLSGVSSLTAVTNGAGIARNTYNPPLTVNELGETVDDAADVGASTLTLHNLIPRTGTEGVVVYQINSNDPILGTEETDASFYGSFLTDEGIVAGGTSNITWEDLHRLFLGLQRPKAFDINSQTTQKTILAKFDPLAIHPFKGTLGVAMPIPATSVITTGSDTVVTFAPLVAFDEDLLGPIRGYLVVAPALVTLRAKVFNVRLGKEIFSNLVRLELTVPSHMDGTYLVESLSDALAEGLFPDAGLGELVYEGSKVPLGLRLRSGVSFASALNGVTFLNLEQPPTLGFQYEVV